MVIIIIIIKKQQRLFHTGIIKKVLLILSSKVLLLLVFVVVVAVNAIKKERKGSNEITRTIKWQNLESFLDNHQDFINKSSISRDFKKKCYCKQANLPTKY